MDPVTLMVASGAVGGIAGGIGGKFAEKAWESGEKWLATYFEDHKPKAQAKAQDNAKCFLNFLAANVDAIVKDNPAAKEMIEVALSNPDFSDVLKRAIIVSSLTPRKEKHILLAALVADRLQQGEESIHALTARLACDAISSLSVNQLKVLALDVNLVSIRPLSVPEEVVTQSDFDAFVKEWLEMRFNLFQEVSFSNIDLTHLESLSCINLSRLGMMSLEPALKTKFEHPKFSCQLTDFLSSEIGKKVKAAWDQGLNKVHLTTIGELIGIYVSDLVTHGKTSLSSEWL